MNRFCLAVAGLLTLTGIGFLPGCAGENEPAAGNPDALAPAPHEPAGGEPSAPALDAGDNASDVRNALSEHFPDDLPLYPQSTVVLADSARPSEYRAVELTTNAPFEQVRAFYESELKKNGWEIVNAEVLESGVVANFRADKQKRRTDIQVDSARAGTTAIKIAISPLK